MQIDLLKEKINVVTTKTFLINIMLKVTKVTGCIISFLYNLSITRFLYTKIQKKIQKRKKRLL